MGIMLDLMERGDSAALDLIADTANVLKWYVPQLSTCTDNEGVVLTTRPGREYRIQTEIACEFIIDHGIPMNAVLGDHRDPGIRPSVDCSDPAVQAWALAHWPSEWKPR